MGTVDSDSGMECSAKNIISSKNISLREESPDNCNSLRLNSKIINEIDANPEKDIAILVNGNGYLPESDQNWIETPDNTPDMIVDETPDNTPDVIADEMPDNTPDVIVDETLDNTPDMIVDEMPDNTPDVMTGETPDYMPVATADEMPSNTPDMMMDETPDGMMDETPDNTLDAMADEMLGNIPDVLADEMPGNIPDAMADKTPDEIPDDTLASECDPIDETEKSLFQIKVLDDEVDDSVEQSQWRSSNPLSMELEAPDSPSMTVEKIATDERNSAVKVSQERDANFLSIEPEASRIPKSSAADKLDTDEQDAEEALTEFLKLNNKTREKHFISDAKDESNKFATNKSTPVVNKVKTYPSRKLGTNAYQSKLANNEALNEKLIYNFSKALNNKLTQNVKDTPSPGNAKIGRFEPKMTTERLLNLLEEDSSCDDEDPTISAPVSLGLRVPKLKKSEIDKLCNSRESEPSGMLTRKRKLKFSSNGKLIKRDKTRNLDKKYRSAGAKILYSSDSQGDITSSESSESEVESRPKMGATRAPISLPSKTNAKFASQNYRRVNRTDNMRMSSASKMNVHPIQILSTVAGGLQLIPNNIRVVKFTPQIIEEKNNRISQGVKFQSPIESTKEKIRSTFANLPGSPQAKVSKSTSGAVSSLGKFVGRSDLAGKCAPRKCKPFSGPKNSYLQPIFDCERDYEYECDSRPEEVTQTTPVVQILRDIHKNMPNWNLHILPDSKTYCMSEIARGPTGMPTLSKNIELDEHFSARVYIHQLHVKRFDGVFDTQDSLIKLIKEVDALPS